MRRVLLVPSLALAVLTAIPTTATAETVSDESSSAQTAVRVLEEVVLLEDAGAFDDHPVAAAVAGVEPGEGPTGETTATEGHDPAVASGAAPARGGPSPTVVSWLVTLVLVAIAGTVIARRRRREAARATYEMPFSLPPADAVLHSDDDDGSGPVEVWRAVVFDESTDPADAVPADAGDGDLDGPDGAVAAPARIPPPPPRGGRGVVRTGASDRARAPSEPASSPSPAGAWPAPADGGVRGPPPPPWELDEPPPPPPVTDERSAEPDANRPMVPATSADVPAADRSGTADVVIEAGRRMTAALDGASVRRIAVETAATLLPGGEAAFVDGRSSTARWARAAPAWATTDPTDERSIVRVLETAQSGWSAASDPTAGDVVVAAAPVLVDGTVVGAIVVGRPGDDGFSSDDIATLDLLTPVVGSALGAAEAHLRAVAAAEVDELTRLRNRRRLDADLAALDREAEVAFAMVDVDHFKHLNDSRGHAAGDLALQLVATAIAGAVRPGDAAYRYGGEEFSVLLHGCDPATAVEVMDGVRRAVADLDVPDADQQPLGRMSVSVGVATSAAGPLDQLVERADAALYAAKEGGRDRVVLADHRAAVPGGTDAIDAEADAADTSRGDDHATAAAPDEPALDRRSDRAIGEAATRGADDGPTTDDAVDSPDEVDRAPTGDEVDRPSTGDDGGTEDAAVDG